MQSKTLLQSSTPRSGEPSFEPEEKSSSFKGKNIKGYISDEWIKFAWNYSPKDAYQQFKKPEDQATYRALRKAGATAQEAKEAMKVMDCGEEAADRFGQGKGNKKDAQTTSMPHFHGKRRF